MLADVENPKVGGKNEKERKKGLFTI